MKQELIEGLFQQAGGRVQRPSPDLVLTYSEECDPYEFARLIVQECIALCEQVVDGGCGSAEDCVEELKQHFEIGFHFDNEDE